MKVEDVRAMIEELQRCTGDNQHAHGVEDWLYISVLEAIANGAPQPRKLAREALKAQDVDYKRWYA